MQKKTFTVEEAKKKLEYFCSYQERYHKEIEQKLTKMGMILKAKEQIIIYLLENNFLNEERYAKAFSRGKFRIKKWGKRRIIRELKSKSISEYNINSGLKEIDDLDYKNTFNKLAQKRFLELKETNKYKKRKKLANYLLYRGWESDLVYKKVTELIV